MRENAGVIIRFEETVLLGKRSLNGCKYEGYWSIPCGFVEKGESTFGAAERELLEETGIKIDRPLEHACTFRMSDEEKFHIYLHVASEMLLPSLDAEDYWEHSEWGYFRSEPNCLPDPISKEIKKAILLTNK